MQYDVLFKDVASVLVQKCVNPESNRPYTSTMLERALRDAHFAVDPKRSAKQQALEVRRGATNCRLGALGRTVVSSWRHRPLQHTGG